MAHAHAQTHAGPTLRRQLLEGVYGRVLNPGVLRFAGRRGAPWAIVRHVGRRSGRPYATPVLWPRETDDGFRILVAFGPETDWCRNILAAGRYTLLWQGREVALVDPELTETHGAWRLFRSSRYLSARRVAPAAAPPG